MKNVANMIFANIYPLYLNRLEKNGRSKEELDQVIEWFTGFNQAALQALIDEKASFRTFFEKSRNSSECAHDQKALFAVTVSKK